MANKSTMRPSARLAAGLMASFAASLALAAGAAIAGWAQNPPETLSTDTVQVPKPAQAQTPARTLFQAQVSQETSGQQQFTPEDEGDALMGHQRYQAAIEAYQRTPQITAAVWNKMGIAYQLLYNMQDAERCYQTAYKLEPKNATVLNNMGSIAMSQKQFAAAEKLYRKAMKLEPNSALFRKNLGTAYLSDRQYKKGWEQYRAALLADPQIFSRSAGVQVENPSSAANRGAMNYYMAKGCVLAGARIQAIEYLRLALDEGFTSPKKLIADQEFASLRDMPEFQAMLESQTESKNKGTGNRE
jgi:Tfp pilus assembly protein PilF